MIDKIYQKLTAIKNYTVVHFLLILQYIYFIRMLC